MFDHLETDIQYKLLGHDRVQVWDSTLNEVCELTDLLEELENCEDELDLYSAIQRTRV